MMTFDDQREAQRRAQAPATFPEPKPGERICEDCQPRVALVLDLSKPGYEYRCPKCGHFERWIGWHATDKHPVEGEGKQP